MFFEITDWEELPHTTLEETLFRNTLRQSTCEIVPNICKISVRVLLSWFFVNLREVDSEKISPSFRWNLSGVS